MILPNQALSILLSIPAYTIIMAFTIMLHGTLLICMNHIMGQCTCLLAFVTVGCITLVMCRKKFRGHRFSFLKCL